MTILEAFRKSTSLLRGDDGRMSFSKLVLVVLVGGWLSGRELEASLALVFLLATYGLRGLRLYLKGSEGERAG